MKKALIIAALASAVILGDCDGGNQPVPAAEMTGVASKGAIVPRHISSNPDSIDMVFVEGGTFMMGCTPEQGGEEVCDGGEIPARSVTVGGFYIGKTEVTQGLWKAVMGSLPSDSVSSRYGIGDNYPVYYVSWYEAKEEFIRKLNAMTGKKYRLPTEEEWEYAARGGNKSKGYKYSGSNNPDDVAWHRGNSGKQARPVETRAPNELGIYDMSGNVYEWTSTSGETSWGYIRKYRGGSWQQNTESCRVSARIGFFPSTINNDIGFRLALSTDGDTSSSVEEEAVLPPRPDVSSNPDSIAMVYVKGGTFMMGCTPEQGKNCAEPARKVTVGGFYIAKYECTYGLWKAVMDIRPYYNQEEDYRPVNLVGWKEVQTFMEKLNAKTGKKYRLPTEAEWEYAARGGNRSKGYKYSGSNNVDKVAWYCDAACVDWENNHGSLGIHDRIRPVGTKAPNELGIYDMSGNMWELIDGGYVARGGCWQNGASFCRVSSRVTGIDPDDDGSRGDGFRLVLDP